MSVINHVNVYYDDDPCPFLYCELKGKVVRFTQNFVDKNCLLICPFLSGSAQGHGIECQYEDSYACKEKFQEIVVADPYYFCENRKEVRSKDWLTMLKNGGLCSKESEKDFINKNKNIFKSVKHLLDNEA